MVFNIFTPGTKAKAEEVNENFSNIMYSVLMNRMEKDQQGDTHLDETIYSDQFNCACGRYKTVCVGATTSVFNINYYLSQKNEPIPHTLCYTFCGCSACTFYCVYTYCIDFCLRAGEVYYGGDNILCVTNCNPINIANYACVKINVNNNNSLYCGTLHRCYNINNSISQYNCTSITTKYDTASDCYDLVLNDEKTHFCFFVNNSYVCCQPTCCPLNIRFYVREKDNSSGDASYVTVRINYSLIGYIITNSTVNTNIKTYSTVKNVTILAVNAELPEGNSITYDIKNQDGATYLCDAEPNKIYNLYANDSCCFYAVIKQNVECNLCNPQKLYGYALKFF